MCVYMYIHTYYVKAGSILVGGLVRDIGQDSFYPNVGVIVYMVRFLGLTAIRINS